jgi:hypothetical protein
MNLYENVPEMIFPMKPVFPVRYKEKMRMPIIATRYGANRSIFFLKKSILSKKRIKRA